MTIGRINDDWRLIEKTDWTVVGVGEIIWGEIGAWGAGRNGVEMMAYYVEEHYNRATGRMVPGYWNPYYSLHDSQVVPCKTRSEAEALEREYEVKVWFSKLDRMITKGKK